MPLRIVGTLRRSVRQIRQGRVAIVVTRTTGVLTMRAVIVAALITKGVMLSEVVTPPSGLRKGHPWLRNRAPHRNL